MGRALGHAAIVVALFWGGAIVLWQVSNYPHMAALRESLILALQLAFAGISVVVTRAAFRLGPQPLHTFVNRLRSQSSAILEGIAAMLLAGATMAATAWTKMMIPTVAGFTADPMLANLDRMLFGTDPWRILRADWIMPIYGIAYVYWMMLVVITLITVTFVIRSGSMFLAFVLTAILGAISQYFLPSAGPIFFERVGFGSQFVELTVGNHESFRRFSDYLWAAQAVPAERVGLGISAMPSMHVAFTVWIALALGRRWLWATVPYILIIWAASIASGWHYATDGPAGAAIALLGWFLAVRLKHMCPPIGAKP